MKSRNGKEIVVRNAAIKTEGEGSLLESFSWWGDLRQMIVRGCRQSKDPPLA